MVLQTLFAIKLKINGNIPCLIYDLITFSVQGGYCRCLFKIGIGIKVNSIYELNLQNHSFTILPWWNLDHMNSYFDREEQQTWEWQPADTEVVVVQDLQAVCAGKN